MAGLFDLLNSDDAKFGIGLLAAAGPSATPLSFGQRLQGAMQGMDAQKQAAAHAKLVDLQAQQAGLTLEQLRQQMADDAAARGVLKNVYGAGMPGLQAPSLSQPVNSALPPEFRIDGAPAKQTPSVTPKADIYTQYKNIAAQMASAGLTKQVEQYATLAEKFRPKYSTTPQIVRDPGTGKLVNVILGEDGTSQVMPFGVKPDIELKDTGGEIVPVDKNAITSGFKLPKTGNPFSDLVLRGPDGAMTPNAPLVGVKQGIAKAGATNVNVSSDKSYFGNIAEGLAKADVSLIEAGRSAPDRIASAQRIKETLRQNPITGTGAELRLSVNRAFATAGLIDPKQANATEALVTDLASQTLDAIKTSGLGSGQGFTDKDRQFLQDAKSGRIEMTPQNIERIADLNEKQARASIKRANTVIGKLRSSPLSGSMGQQLDPIDEPAAPKANAAAQRTVVRRGNYGGKRVIEYSDGTVEYAN